VPSYTPELISKSSHRTSSAVTFKEFAALARSRLWSPQALAERFRGRIDNPTEFFSRVLGGKFPDNIVTYRSVIEFYFAAQTVEPSAGRRVCACGCGRVVFDRKKWATPGCRTKHGRDRQIRDRQPLDFVDARLRQSRRVGPLPSTSIRGP